MSYGAALQTPFNAAEHKPAAPRGEVIPKGWQPMAMTSAEWQQSNSNPQNWYMKCTFAVTAGPYAGTVLYTNFNLKNDNPTAQRISEEQMTALCLATGVLVVQSFSQFIGIPFDGLVGIERGSKINPSDPNSASYDDKNRIDGYDKLGSRSGQNTAAPGAGPAGVPWGAGTAPGGPPAAPTWNQPASNPAPAGPPAGPPAAPPSGPPAGPPFAEPAATAPAGAPPGPPTDGVAPPPWLTT
jgi:hypothetical protein